MSKDLLVKGWEQYELIDCGSGWKYERFGKFRLIRPEPHAIWSPKETINEWRKNANFEFKPTSKQSGLWKNYTNAPKNWQLNYNNKEGLSLTFNIQLTKFKHIGIFPEQSTHWDFIYDTCKKLKQPKVLNLFAYTGGASLAAKAAGADVIHLDSVRQVVSWAKENQESSGLKDIRWMIEDAMKYVDKCYKKGVQYDGIILDPPAYGIGANGERWKLNEQIENIILKASEISKNGFLCLNTYAHNFSSYALLNMYLNSKNNKVTSGELVIQSSHKHILSTGNYLRVLPENI